MEDGGGREEAITQCNTADCDSGCTLESLGSFIKNIMPRILSQNFWFAGGWFGTRA